MVGEGGDHFLPSGLSWGSHPPPRGLNLRMKLTNKPCLEGERMLDYCPSIHCPPTTIWRARAHGDSRREGFVIKHFVASRELRGK